MSLWVTQLVPFTWQVVDVLNRIIHIVFWPASALPAELAVVGIYTNIEPVYLRVVK